MIREDAFSHIERVKVRKNLKNFQLCGCDSIGHFHAIYCNENGDIILIVEKEFGEEFDKMKFKSQTTTSSGGLEEPCKGDCVLPFKGGCYKPVTCPPIRNALLTYYWLPYKGHFLVISLFGLFLLLFNISLHCCFIYIAYCFHIIPSCPKFFISSSPEFGMPVKYL